MGQSCFLNYYSVMIDDGVDQEPRDCDGSNTQRRRSGMWVNL